MDTAVMADHISARASSAFFVEDLDTSWEPSRASSLLPCEALRWPKDQDVPCSGTISMCLTKCLRAAHVFPGYAALHLFLIDYLLYLMICTLLFSSAELEFEKEKIRRQLLNIYFNQELCGQVRNSVKLIPFSGDAQGSRFAQDAPNFFSFSCRGSPKISVLCALLQTLVSYNWNSTHERCSNYLSTNDLIVCIILEIPTSEKNWKSLLDCCRPK
jgi:hypothetical protein